MSYWFTSDTHYYHDKVLQFCPSTRDGKDHDQMTELMIQNWNSVVMPDDVVYHMGDFAFKSKEHLISVKNRLNGKIHLIYGNHDYRIVKNKEIQAMFESTQWMKNIKIEGNNFCMSHAPFAEWPDCHKGVIHLHGHLHGNKDNLKHQQRFKIMDVGVDTRSDKLMLPYSLKEVLEHVKNKEVMTHH